MISFQCAVAVNFTISYFYVWKDRARKRPDASFKRFIKLYGIYNLSTSAVFIFRLTVLLVIERFTGWDVVFCNLSTMCLSGIINFTLNNFVIFKTRKQASSYFYKNDYLCHAMMILACIISGLIVALIPNLIWLLGWVAGKIVGYTLPYHYFGIAAIAVACILWMTLAYGWFIGRWNVESKEMEYIHKDIPMAFDGFKIVHISDLHLSTFNDNPQKFKRFIDEINRHSPDIVCFTGDMVTIGTEEAKPYTEILKSIDSKHGILSVLGNHDFLIYRMQAGDDRDNAVADFADYQLNVLGWQLLRNEHTVIQTEDGSKITFIGVDNANFGNQGFRTIHKGDLRKAMYGTDGFRILLSHDPSHWRAEVLDQTDIPLTLSGHTHSAQIRILGWTPAALSFKDIAGRYEHNGQTLYINVGLGCTVPFRIGVNPEVTVITLKTEKG